MSEETSVARVEPAGKLTFNRKNDLVKTLKKLDKQTDAAIDFLTGVMIDDENELKVRMDAAKFLIEKKVQISESISKDQMSRMLAEIKLNSNFVPKTKDVEGSTFNAPRATYDFDTIIDVGGNSIVDEDGVVDLGNVKDI